MKTGTATLTMSKDLRSTLSVTATARDGSTARFGGGNKRPLPPASALYWATDALAAWGYKPEGTWTKHAPSTWTVTVRPE